MIIINILHIIMALGLLLLTWKVQRVSIPSIYLRITAAIMIVVHLVFLITKLTADDNTQRVKVEFITDESQ